MKIDAILVLGKELNRDEGRGRRELAARAAGASVALRHGAEIVYTLEAQLRGQELSGSRIVREALAQLGVPDERIYSREETRSTREEALLAAALVAERGHRRLGVVTASYHVARARIYFAQVMDPRKFEVIAPENFIQRASAEEKALILAATPTEETLEVEGRVEQVLSLLGGVAGRVPLGGRVEMAAAAFLRRVGS